MANGFQVSGVREEGCKAPFWQNSLNSAARYHCWYRAGRRPGTVPTCSVPSLSFPKTARPSPRPGAAQLQQRAGHSFSRLPTLLDINAHHPYNAEGQTWTYTAQAQTSGQRFVGYAPLALMGLLAVVGLFIMRRNFNFHSLCPAGLALAQGCKSAVPLSLRSAFYTPQL